MDRFLVTEPSDMKERGWAELDFVLISGDAYVVKMIILQVVSQVIVQIVLPWYMLTV